MKHVLLVDDSTAIRAHLVQIITEAIDQVQIVEAASFSEGVSLLTGRAGRYDALISDFMLDTGHTGLELMQLVSAVAGALPVKRVLITQGGKLSPTELVAAQSLNVVVLPKPTVQTQDSFLARLAESL